MAFRLACLVLGVLLGSAAPRAQPLVPPSPVAFRLVLADGAPLDGRDPLTAPTPGGDVYTGSVIALVSAPMAMVGGLVAVTAVFVLDAAQAGCSPFGCTGTLRGGHLYTAAWALGGAAAATGNVLWLERYDRSAPSVLPAPDVRRGDWRWALAGVAVGTAVGVGVQSAFLNLDDEDSSVWPVFAVPVAQGLGAGVALALRP